MCSSSSSYGAMLLSTDIIETLNGDLKRLPLIIILALSSQLLPLFRSWPACTHACIGWKLSLDRSGYVFLYATIKYFPVISCTCRSGSLLVPSKFCLDYHFVKFMICNTVTPVLSSHSRTDTTKILMTNGS